MYSSINQCSDRPNRVMTPAHLPWFISDQCITQKQIGKVPSIDTSLTNYLGLDSPW